jgi:hypothetical protein
MDSEMNEMHDNCDIKAEDEKEDVESEPEMYIDRG